MRVNVRMNKKAVRTLSDVQVKAITMTGLEVLSQTRNSGTMPFDIGNLQNESTFVDDNEVRKGVVKIVSDTPYARRLYYHPEYEFNQSGNPNAGGEWWAPWISGDKKKLPMKLFRQFYKKMAGRIVR